MRKVSVEAESVPSILLVKVGSHPELKSLALRVRGFVPDARLFGIGTSTTTEDDVGIAVAHERDVGTASHREWWDENLYVDPDLYLKIRAKEGHLLNLSERIGGPIASSHATQINPWSNVEPDVTGRARLTLRCIAFWDWVLLKNNIDAVVFGALPHNYWDAVLYEVAMAREIQCLILSSNRPFLDSIYLAESPSEIGDLRFGRSILGVADVNFGLVEDSINRRERMLKSMPFDKKETDLPTEMLRSKWLAGIPSAVLKTKNLKPRRILHSVKRRWKTLLENRERQLLAKIEEIHDPYFLIELQRPNNSATQVRGYMYRTPREMIAHISDSLPAGMKLVVRETSRNRTERSARPRGFWREIAALPSVCIAADELDTKQLLQNSAGLIEISYSTLAMSAICEGVPVVVLGITHLNGLPKTHVVSEISSLKTVLESVAHSRTTEIDDPRIRKLAIQAWLDQTREGTLEGNLSSDNFTGEEDSKYRQRLVNNVAAAIAAWYETCVRKKPGGDDNAP